MRPTRMAAAVAAAFPLVSATFCLTLSAHAQSASTAAETPAKSLGVVTITSGQPTSLPTQIPTTMEGATREQVARTVNATDSEDALKYFPSLLVRKRYIGDYNHAILSTRASGTGNSARSMVYADGILLSNYLGNGVGGLSFPPRWGLVTPEEIERVDVMYGPFSAAYAGNSVGAVVDYVTRMPTQFEGHASAGFVSQPFELYRTNETYRAWQTSASLGNKNGDWSWWLNVNHTDSTGQPLTFATRLVSSGSGTGGTPVTGAVLDKNNANAPIYILGTGTQFHTIQDHAKAKLAYDVTPTVRATYTLGMWHNTSEGRPESYLRNAAGQPVYSGTININGVGFAAPTGGDFALTNQTTTHFMHGLSLKSHTRGTWDWELAASLYDYHHDDLRQNGAGNTLPTAATGGAGTLADGAGTGWDTLALRGTWRPDGMRGAHIVDFGVQQDSYKLRFKTYNLPGNWLSDAPAATQSAVSGNARGSTQLRSLWGQDVWGFAPQWKAVLGVRAENWVATRGLTEFSSTASKTYADRSEQAISPKAALSYQVAADTVLKASVGRAVRFPTVAELYGATSSTNSQYINDPNLKPEKSWTSELSAEKEFDSSLLRVTYFAETTRDSLYSQTTVEPSITAANKNVTRVQNIGKVQTQGLEAAFSGTDVFWRNLDLNASITYTESLIKANDGFVVTPGDTLGKRQPNIPRWRATALASYRFNEQWNLSYGARYSGQQYRTLNNADVNGYTYQGVSEYFTTDLRAVWHINKQYSAAFGIDNLNNYRFWNFHPYPQRSYHLSVRADF